MFAGIDHIDIVVKDVQKMADYLVSLGFEVLRHTDSGRGSVELRFPGEGPQPFIELTPAQKLDGSTIPLGLRHIALRTPDLPSVYGQLIADGFALEGEPRTIADTGRTVANLIDPEGNILQLAGA